MNEPTVCLLLLLLLLQGMNELIAPLYYLFKNDPDPLARKYAGA